MKRLKEVWLKIFHFLKELLRQREDPKQMNNWQALIGQFVMSVVTCFIIEVCSRHGMMAAFQFVHSSTKAFLYNCVLIYVTSLPIFLFRKRRFLRVLIFGFWIALGVTNGIILSNRVTPFTGPDFKNFTEGKAVMGKYMSHFKIFCIYAIVIIGIILAIIYLFRSPKFRGKMHYPIVIVGLVAAVGGFYGLTKLCVNARILSTYFGNIAFAYQDYGFPYCFTVTVLDTGIREPNNYSPSLVNSITSEDDKAGTTTTDTDDLPNIIVVQLESFFDPQRVNYLQCSEDPIPNWHELENSCTHGYYTVPTIGAGTANTEFETLTGMSLRFFGAGEYPFKSILSQEPCESSAFDLKTLGYSASALHDNEANFYSRKKVYKNLGFDTFTSKEYMQNQTDVNHNGWMKDRNLIKPINDAMDATPGKDYIFTVSVQPHGAYPNEEVLDDPEITVSGNMTDAQRCAWEYYVNEIHEEDEFIKNLIDSINQRDEKSIILFYGDHLPTMNLQDKDMAGGNLYQTNYLIWNNFGLKIPNQNITSYRAIATIMNALDIHTGTMFRFQQAHTGEEENFFNEMQTLQYDLLYGKQYAYNGNDPYQPNPKYRLGVKNIVMTGIIPVRDGYLIKGRNFTQSCKAVVDGEVQEDTEFIDINTLKVSGDLPSKGTNIAVGVQSASKTHRMLSYAWNSYTIMTDESTFSSPSASPSPKPAS
jgi:phosphoglycerol transferase MdoB-like AlkP superfamily enzyme